MFSFHGVVCAEGSTGNLRIAVPVKLGVPAPACYRAKIGDVELLVFVRAPPGRAKYPTFTLPKWAFPALVAGVEIDVELTVPVRASGQLDGFDWLRFVPEKRCFPTQDGDELVLHTRSDPPFRIRRAPQDLQRHYQLLGYYQAEGAKADSGRNWSFASSLLDPARAVLPMLEAWGISRERCSAEVLHGPKELPAEAVAYYEPLGLEVTAVRPRSGKGKRAVVVHVRSSSLLREMVALALLAVAKEGFPSPDTAMMYSLCWLDGDGSVTYEKTGSIRLDLAGLEYEHIVVQEAFRVAFGWERRGKGWIDSSDGTRIFLRLPEVAQLLEAGAFPYSMNRVKLLLSFDTRTEELRWFAKQPSASRLNGASWAVKHGLVELAPVRGFRLSADGIRVVEAHARLLPEIEHVRAVAPPMGITRLKGVPYPGRK